LLHLRHVMGVQIEWASIAEIEHAGLITTFESVGRLPGRLV